MYCGFPIYEILIKLDRPPMYFCGGHGGLMGFICI